MVSKKKNKDLDQMSSEELGILFPIILVEHRHEWDDLFKKEKDEVCGIIGIKQIIKIEHIGSTAVPDLLSKPTIDILLEIREDAQNQRIIDGLKSIGYHFIPKPQDPPPHMMFVKGYTRNGFEGQAYHIHVRYQGDWDQLYFRDYLKNNATVAKQYGELKKILALKYKNNRDGYTDAKSDFIQQITCLAKASRSVSQ